MLEKDPTSYSLITYLWVFLLSTWGGIVSFNSKRKRGMVRAINITELLGEISTAGFVGILTFYICEWAKIPQLLSAAFIGICSHMGSRAIYALEKALQEQFPIKINFNDEEGDNGSQS